MNDTMNGFEDSNYFTPDEIEDKKLIRKVRRDLITELTKGAIDTSPRSVEVLNGLLTSYGKDVVETASLRARVNHDTNTSTVLEMVAALIMTPDEDIPVVPVNRNLELADNLKKKVEDDRMLEVTPRELHAKDYVVNDDDE